MSSIQPAPDIYRIRVPLAGRPREVSAYLLANGAGSFTLVDGGMNTDACWTALGAGVREAAGGWEAIELHVVTHMHLDHIGLVERVRAASGAPLAIGRLDGERAAHANAEPEEEADYREHLLRSNGAPDELLEAVQRGRERANPLASWVEPDRLLEEGDELPGGWRVVWTPGHTAGHISLLRPSDRVLIGGDAVLPKITATIGVNRQRADPVGDFLAALQRLLDADLRLLLPGHGEPIAEPAHRILQLLDDTTAETARVHSLLEREPQTAWQLAARRYAERDLPASMQMQALRETLAHLQHLEAAGQAVRSGQNDAVRWTLPPASPLHPAAND